MAGQPQVYDQILMAVNGQILGEAESVEVRNENTSQDVLTLVKGFAGETPGPDKLVCSVSSFLPSSGQEFAFDKAEQLHAIYTVSFIQRSGSKKLTSTGFFRNFRASAGVGQNSKVDVEFHGTPAKFE